ncbi:MAG: diadenylate cyclase CdaA [Tannerella sp.]|jgi:uncharacterized protein (TIGR00159 family)|nr:diadenylate cyclase CdaA [Tannerella sp.]
MLDTFGLKDIIDIFLVAFFMYQTYKLMRSSGNLAIFSGVVSVIVVWVLVSQVFEMKLIGAILDKFISVGFIVLVILFQDEIRRFLAAVGSSKGWRFMYRLFERRKVNKDGQKYITPLVMACINMSKTKTGALIVIQREINLAQYIQTGEQFRADINARLIENIFYKNSPLHDGALIIADEEIRAAECILPVAHDAIIPKEMGLRHRSGLGMSIETDAIVIIVSEQRGSITVAHNGELKIDVSAEDLQQILSI